MLAQEAELPAWSRRMRRERERRGWSQGDAVDRMIAHAQTKNDRQISTRANVLRRWKAWEAGENLPDDRYQGYIASTFGTVRHAVFPAPGERAESELLAGSGMDTLEIITKVKTSDVDSAVLEALEITVDQLCSQYAYVPAERLVLEGREWLQRVAELRTGRLTLNQHRDILALAGWLALLVGCVEYDSGDRVGAEATRRAALSLGEESGRVAIQGWAHEMRAWFALTQNDLTGVIAAARAGLEVAPQEGVAAQLVTQEAKAWAKLGDRRQVEIALERGRSLLDSLPYPSNVANHFIVDPAKFDYYSMAVYSMLGEDTLAAGLAQEVIADGTEPDGRERAPMRNAEARIALGVAAARSGDLDQAVTLGLRSLEGERRSIPGLLARSRDLAEIVKAKYGSEPLALDYLERLRELG
jgi:tetratricopeptide (TPR) repeat protein